MAADSPTWQASARKFAATAVVVAIALYVAARLLEAVVTVLIVVAAVSLAGYVGVLVARYRRSRW